MLSSLRQKPLKKTEIHSTDEKKQKKNATETSKESDLQKEAIKQHDDQSDESESELAPKVETSEGEARGTSSQDSSAGGVPPAVDPELKSRTTPQKGDPNFIGPIRNAAILRKWAQAQMEKNTAPKVASMTEEKCARS